ncbi:switch-associated protein 70-like protein [Carex littledalei]|uniref:Switch-associated protein 70-like protein n=1 Tax=Carex littledalei TaxID=544730 RepID=A0A833VU42_9POAL|nr:switch-associated protein 70-like protein [Carex littledalei]
MTSNGTPSEEGTENNLEKIKKQLHSSSAGRYLLQGPLLKRSETLRNWNERWVILDPTSGRMEYKVRRNEVAAKGAIYFDATSTITLSPVNFHGLPKYDGCCFYIGTPQKKDYFLCAETPGAAKAWISTLHATQLVLRAHKEAVNSIAGSTNTASGTVATVVAAANATAMEASKEIETAMKVSLRSALGFMPNTAINQNQLEDDLTVMKETLRVKDEELSQLAKDVRARDSTINELAQKLTETAKAAQSAAAAAQTLDEQRHVLFAEIDRIKRDAEKQIQFSLLKVMESEKQVTNLTKDKEILLKQREAALQESHLWQTELAKARDQRAVLEASLAHADEKARVSEASADARVKEACGRLETISKERAELLSLVHALQSQLKSGGSSREDRLESRSGSGNSSPLTKHVDQLEERADVDKACVVSGEEVQLAVDPENIRSVDVREISPEGEERGSFDVGVVAPPS